MIKLKFKDKDDELMFFKHLHYLSIIAGCHIKYAEMINDLDVVESEKEDE